MRSIHKRLIIQNIIGIIVLLIIGIFIYSTVLLSISIYSFLGMLPFLILYIIAIIYFIKEILFIYGIEQKKNLYLNKNSNTVDVKIAMVKKHLLSGSEAPNLYCYQIICFWRNPNSNKKYKFKSGYFWNNPGKFINTSVTVYLDENYKKYYIDLTEIEKWDNEQKKISNIEERKYLTLKLYYNLKKSYVDDNLLIGNDIIRNKQIKIYISKIKKVIKLIKNEQIVKIYLYTFGKQIEINKKNNDNFDELIYLILTNVNNKCKIKD